ncbi:MAG: molybdopterin-synthase adenylyltransferase MoeB [Alphaproteobacteria bacterium]|nr:molybdopterin-synthase adenylyltransferase MoeB [Alphaproteobacteria bacterium]
MAFNEEQIRRYARHIILPEVGAKGQEKLANARVLVVGAGGLGSPSLLYLTAAGVGTIGVIDDDVVDLSNLQRQVVHPTSRIGVPKVESAALTLAEVNPNVRVIRHHARLDAENALMLFKDYDLIADGSDNFPTRFLVNDACYFAQKPLVTAAILRFDGQLATFRAYEEGNHPCYRCIFREPPPPGSVPNCAEGGVFGAVAGVMGTIQATEVVKELLGIGQSLDGHMLIYDGLEGSFRKIAITRDRACPLCGENPTIHGIEASSEAACAG